MGQLLYSIEDIFSDQGYLSEHNKGYYNIPLYQRGYKWEPKHVVKLLDDVNNFVAADKKFYCLQNITIVPDVDCFNIVDGQQRLTTLTIILSYLDEKMLVWNKVRFPENSLRNETNKFLNTVVASREAIFPDTSWDEFISRNPEYDHQDIFHIYEVYNAVKEWFESKEKAHFFSVKDFTKKLLGSLKLIVNSIEQEGSNEEKIFSNLNSKRVNLDGADLIRAILVTRVAQEEGKREGDVKNIVRVNERRVKIGWELDQINNWWSKVEVRNYFAKFVNIRSEEVGVGNKLFSDSQPINILYLLFAEKKGETELTLELIEKNNNDAIGLYKELIRLNSTLMDWFQDKKIYHMLGFLFNHKAKREFNFRVVWKAWEESGTRENFYLYLKNAIRETIFSSEDFDMSNLELNWYAEENQKLVQVLLLMDIIHSLRNNQPFLPYNAFTKSSNDIEHIFPQNPKKIKDKEAYIKFLNNSLPAGSKAFDLRDFDKKIQNEAYQAKAEAFIKDYIQSVKIHSIGNLVLLYSSLNKSISNSTYAVKRTRIIEFYNKGNFIQPHTFQVFVRYYHDKQNKNKEYEHWSNNDIEANAIRITNEINDFLN